MTTLYELVVSKRNRLAEVEKEMSHISSWWFCQMSKGCEGRPEMATQHTHLSLEARDLRKELRQAANLLQGFLKDE